MRDLLCERAIEIGKYIVNSGATVRAAAKTFGVSKSTVFMDVTKRLENFDYDLFLKVQQVLDENKAERHIRGGLATKEKYELLAKARKSKSAKKNEVRV